MNKSVTTTHFKMESIKHAIIAMIQPGCWMASIDLKDAYYSVFVGERSTKLLKFDMKRYVNPLESQALICLHPERIERLTPMCRGTLQTQKA